MIFHFLIFDFAGYNQIVSILSVAKHLMKDLAVEVVVQIGHSITVYGFVSIFECALRTLP